MLRDPAIPTLQEQERYLEKKRSGHGLETNFRIFNDFLKKKSAGYATVSIFLVIAFVHHFLSMIRQYKKLVNNHYAIETTIIDSILSASQYGDIQGLITTDITVAYFILVICLTMTIGLTLLYILILILGPEYKVKKKFLGKFFFLFCIIYIWLLHFPCMVAFFEFLNCSPTIDCTSSTLRTIIIIFSSLGLLCGIINVLVLTFLFHNNSDNKKDAFNSENTFYLAIFQIYRVLLALLVCIKTTEYSYLWFFILINFCFLLWFLLNLVIGTGFLAFCTSYTRNLFLALLIKMFCESFSMIIDELYRFNTNNTSAENFSLFFVTTLFFVFISVSYNLKTTKCSQIECDILKLSQGQLQKQIYIVLQMLEMSNSDTTVDTFFKGILQRHIEFQCQHHVIKGEGRCFCKKKKVFDPKKKKDFSVDDWILYKAVFVKFLLKSWLETYLEQNQNAFEIQILYAKFMFAKMRNHSIALHILGMLEKRFSFILDRYKAYQLKQAVTKYIKHLNNDSYKGRLEIENALFVEEQIEQIKNNIQLILKQNSTFWQNLQQSTIDLEELDSLLKEQFNKIQKTKQLWISITSYLDYKKKWKFYYAWFTLYISNKKIKNRILDNFQGLQVNENDIFSEELQENNVEEDIASIKSGQQNLEQDKIEIKSKKIVFDKKACIIQANDDSNALIIKVNKQFTRIFGYKREEAVKILTIAHLMPDVFSRVHPSIITDYKITGKSSALYSQRKIYCMHKSGYLFTAWKFLKLYVDLNGVSQFVVMIRPTDLNNEKKHDFIVINSDWEINGMTSNLHQTLHLEQSLFQKSQASLLVNILLIAPKLIQYSKIRNLVNESRDLKIFGMVRNESTKHNKLEPQSSSNSQNLNPVIRVSEMVNSNSLKVGISKPIALYSDIDITSKLYIPQQSLDVPDKSYQNQISSSSDKNEFSEFQNQINQYSKLQEGLAEEIQKQAQQQIEQELKEQFKTNYQRIQTNKEGNASESEDNLSKDEMMNIEQEKRKYRTVQSVLEGKIENGEQITFRMKIPDNFIAACQYYSSQKYKLYQIKRQEDEHVKNQEVQDQGKQKKDKFFVKQGTQQREFKKKARLMFQKAAERQKNNEDRNYYELLLELYQKFMQSDSKKKSFKITCTITFYRVREERIGIIKVLGISEVQKVKRREANRKLSFIPRNMVNKEFNRLNSNVPKQEASRLEITKEGGPQPKYVTMTSDGESKVVSPVQPNQQLKQQLKISTKNNGLGYQLQKEEGNMEDGDDRDMLLDSKGFQKMINWDTFQNQFKMQQGTQSFSLNVLDNIFRKEDNNKPRKLLVKISYLTWFLRLMFISIIGLNLLTYFYKPYTEFNPIKNQAQRIFDLSQMQTYLIEAYDTVLDLLIYKSADYTTLPVRGVYLDTQLNFFTYEQEQIDVGYIFIKDQINNINQQETFLDNSIFFSDPIMDDSITGSINVSLSLDHKDFFTKFIMLEHSIAEMNVTELQEISSNDPSVKFIRFITLPYLYDQLNNAVLALQEILSEKSSSMSSFIVVILILEGSILVVGFVGLLIIIIWICQTYKAVLKIFILIKKNDLNKIVKQQKFIETQFKYITSKDDEITGLLKKNEYSRMNSNQSRHQFQQQQNFLLINEDEEQNMNKKKDKTIIEKKLLRKLTFKLSLAYIILVILTASASITFFLTLKTSTDKISLLIKTGKTVIQDFSDSQLMLIAVKERYFNETNYQEVFLPGLSDLLTKQLSDVKTTPSIDNPNYGSFYDSFQTMYFSNLCQILLDKEIITNDVYNDCKQLLLGKLEDGVVAFNQYYASNTEDYILNRESRFGQIDSDQIWKYNTAVDYIKSAYRGLLTYWSDDLTNLIDSNSTIILALLIVMQIFQLIVFVTIAEMYLVNELNSTFSFYRQVYKSYMPNDIIQKEKIIRAQLIRYNIIKR